MNFYFFTFPLEEQLPIKSCLELRIAALSQCGALAAAEDLIGTKNTHQIWMSRNGGCGGI
jgi:hypothetical protein